ncbi:hypothetical protein ABT340_35825 [Streptosporangium sp. NPDC000239]|uniref:hypothetical protein n=1 Tax=Streptosporangium sp. NPDC000239 TaxID=3154248 RepID=UPI00332DA8A5
MTYAFGAAVRLTQEVRVGGVLTTPASIALSVMLPDGTVTPLSPVADGVGLYHYDYAPTQAGQHIARWVTTGPAGSDEETFDVAAQWSEAGFVSVADAKAHMRKTTTEDDDQLQAFVVTACQMITDRMGQVTPATFTHDVTRYSNTIILPKRPVIAVTTVERLPGGEVLPAADGVAGTAGWWLDGSEGVLRHTGSFGGRVRVTYRAGRTPLPPNFRMAALELVAHLWRGSQHNQAGSRPALGETDAITASVRPFAMPFRVMELLGLKKHQEHDEPLVG